MLNPGEKLPFADALKVIADLPGFQGVEDEADRLALIYKLWPLKDARTIEKLAPLSAAQLLALSADAADSDAMKAIADKVGAINALPGFKEVEQAEKDALFDKLMKLNDAPSIAKLAPLSAEQLLALSADALENNTTFGKIKKYAPIIVMAAAALVFAIFTTSTAGLSLIIPGIIVAGMLYKKSADALKEELDKHAGPKINRPLMWEKDFSHYHQTQNGLDTFEIREDEKLLKKKCYLMLGEGEKANLYYIDSKGLARKMQFKEKINREKFIKYIESQKKILNHSGIIPGKDPDLNQMIQDHVIPDKLQTTRHISKKVIAGIGLALAVAGALAALPFVGIPLAGAIALTALGLVTALAAPLIGGVLKKWFYREEGPTIPDSSDEPDSERIIDAVLPNRDPKNDKNVETNLELITNTKPGVVHANQPPPQFEIPKGSVALKRGVNVPPDDDDGDNVSPNM